MRWVVRCLFGLQCALPIAAAAGLWNRSRVLGGRIDDIDDAQATFWMTTSVASLLVFGVCVVLLPRKVVAANVVGYGLFLPIAEVFQDQWLVGLVSVVQSYPGLGAWLADLWIRVFVFAAAGAAVRGVCWGVATLREGPRGREVGPR